MSAQTFDGAQLHDAGLDWTWNEDVDDQGQRGGWWQCDRCGGIAQGDVSRARHTCTAVCVQCEKRLVWHYFDGMLPPAWITDADERSTAFCEDSDDNCHVAECDQ